MRQEIDLEKIKRTHAALYRPDDLVPADGDDMTWDDGNYYIFYDVRTGDIVGSSPPAYLRWDDEPDAESVQLWQETIMERLAKMEQELAALRKRMDEYEGEL